MHPSPLLRAFVWWLYTFVIAEAVPFAVLYLLSRLDGAPPKVLESFLGMTTMVLIGFGILVAATGDRLLDRGPTRDLVGPLVWIVILLVWSAYFLYKQYICCCTPDQADLLLTGAFGFFAILGATWIKYHDWQREYPFSRALR
jgi:hypothetical protein